MDVEAPVAVRRTRPWRWALLALALVPAAVLLIVWTQRSEIATGYIDRELSRRGVQAEYHITHLGLGRQRLENVRIGDRQHPDLTARSVELQFSYGFRTPRLILVTARGVRLYGRIVDGKLALGEIDKLLPPPSGAPFRLPDRRVDLADAALLLATPAGHVTVALQGKGNLSDGFRGHAAAVSRRLAFGDCIAEAPVANVSLAVSARRPTITGPVRVTRLGCGSNTELQNPTLALDATLAPALDGWIGSSGIDSAGVRFGGNSLKAVRGTISFAGNPRRTKGRIDVAAAASAFGDITTQRLRVAGPYDFSGASTLSLSGNADVRGVRAGASALDPITGALASLAGTPVGPIGEAIAAAAVRAGRMFDAAGAFQLVRSGPTNGLRLNQLTATSRSGARLALNEGEGAAVDLASGAVRLDGRFALTGGGFPSIEADLQQPRFGVPIAGTLQVSPIAAKGARLALAPVRFSGRSDGMTQFETVATMDGPLSDARVAGLVLPVRGHFGGGGFAIGDGCTPASFQSLSYSSLSLLPTRLSLCPVGPALVWKRAGGTVQGGAEIPRLGLAGRLGSSPIGIAARNFRFTLADRAFRSSSTAVRLGRGDGVSRLDLASLTGRIDSRGIAGAFGGTSGKIAHVPLLLSEGTGKWQVIGGRTVVAGAMIVTDEANPSRFYPLRTNDFRLTLVGNKIDADAWLLDRETATRVTRAAVTHALDTGRGSAHLDVPGIRFDPHYQPEQLTRLTLGVIALVEGTLSGEGDIAWGPEGARSTGRFSTEKMNLAAPFGPVTGLTTTITFTDLLGLQTAPDQLATVDRVQAGVDVFDGRVRYQLLPDLKIRVQSAHWPFAGGDLALEETILDFSRPSEKHLTFRLTAMDAASFVQQMQFSNISATGTFDGVVPMIFDQRGGRVVGGHLEGRPEGGVISYIGELSDKQLGAYGKLAFDALKSLRYSKLDIGLNGSLEGEFVASVQLHGVARNAPNPGGITGHVFHELAKIPFRFNITARGPFRAILSTMRSLKDPSSLIQGVLPAELRDQPTTTTVQPEESETVR